jgi:hypothetical protein
MFDNVWNTKGALPCKDLHCVLGARRSLDRKVVVYEPQQRQMEHPPRNGLQQLACAAHQIKRGVRKRLTLKVTHPLAPSGGR